MKKISAAGILFTSFLLLMAFTPGCSRDTTDIEEQNEREPYVARADGARLYSGKKRALIVWANKDPNVVSAKIYWNNDLDSLVYPVQQPSDSVRVPINNLTEGNYTFSIITFDKQNISSGKSLVTGVIYGEQVASLKNAAIKDATYSSISDRLEVFWDSTNSAMNSIEMVYTDSSGHEQTRYINPRDSLSIIHGISKATAGAFKYRVSYVLKDVLDTIHSPYKAISLATFTNPIFQGADPWISQKGEMYYCTYTAGSSIVVRASKKVSDLGKATPVAIWRPPSGTMYSSNIWAPEFHEINGKWYCYFAADNGTNANHRMYVLENSSNDLINGPWEFKGKITDPRDEWAIDGTVLQHEGQMYFLWSGGIAGAAPQNIYIAKMSNPWTITGNRVQISAPVYNWEKYGDAINEGPQVLKNSNGNVFIVYSGSGFWVDNYALGLLTLKPGGDPMNPSDWSKRSTPVFTQATGAHGPGHNGFFKSPDGTEDWIIYHARSLPGGGDTNYRNIRIQKFTWNADGTPNFGRPVGIDTEIPKPSGVY